MNQLLYFALCFLYVLNAQAIINGLKDKNYDFNSTVKIQIGASNSCSGTLISNRTIITAAHCLVSSVSKNNEFGFYEDLSVVIVNKYGSPLAFEVLRPTEANIHPDFGYKNVHKKISVFAENNYIDIAYLQLKKPLLHDWLYNYSNINLERVTTNKSFYISGFGYTKNKISICTDDLGRSCVLKRGVLAANSKRYAQINIAHHLNHDNQRMYKLYKRKSFNPFKSYTQSTKGDSGGSLYDENKNLVGIIVSGFTDMKSKQFFNIIHFKKTQTSESHFLSFEHQATQEFIYNIKNLDPNINILE